MTSCLLLFYTLNLQSQTFILKEVDKAPVIGDCPDTEENKECFEEFPKIYVQETIDIRNLNLGENGKAYVQFEITEEGKIENVRVRSTDEKLEKETRRIIEKIKIKEPAKKDGNAVALLHTIPVTFNNLRSNSYKEFLAQEKAGEKAISPSHSLKDVAQPPLYYECLSSANKKECFINSTERKIKSFVTSNAALKGLINKGEIVKIYFEVDAHSEVKNPIVAFNNNKVRNALLNFISTFKLEKPALNNKDKPVEIFYQVNLIF